VAALDREHPVARRILAYCHDSVGIGHLRRTLAICERIGREYPGTSMLLATGTPYVQLLTQGHSIDYIKLPALEKAGDGTYRSKLLGLDPEQMINCRKSLLLETVRGYRPHLVLVDKAPLGVCAELVPTLEWMKSNLPEAPRIFGMRDIEDEPEITRRRWTRDGVYDALENLYDRIWVYGAQSAFDVVRQYGLSPTVESKLTYVGYVGRSGCQHTAADRPTPTSKTVVVTVGGGTDGSNILRTYLEAAARSVAAAGYRSVVIGGPDLPHEARSELKLLAQATAGVDWLDFEPCMNCRIREADMIVCMGGYNTLCEVTAQGKPALVIPRIRPRLEQKMRAQRWQERGLLRMVPESEFSPAGLAAMTMSMLTESWKPSERLQLDGLEHVMEQFRGLWGPATRSAAEATRASALPV
jgi:predicted glycosyltransferase